MVADQGGDRPAAHDGHGEEHPLVLPRPPERGQHVRVGDPDRLLPDEAEQGVGVDLAHHLGRDIPALPVVEGAPDQAGAALTQGVDQLVASAEHLSHEGPP